MTVSENQAITVSNLSSAISTRQSSLAGNVQVKTEEQVSPGPEGAYRVNISQEAKDLQIKDGDPSKKDEAEQTEKSNSGEAADETSGSESPTNIDEQIKELQEKIKEIKAKITALANDKSEAAQQQRKALEAQLLELTTQLLSLMS